MYIYFTILVVIVLLIVILNQMYKRTNSYKNNFLSVAKFSSHIPNNLDIICTGSSYAKFGIDFKYTKLDGFNFAVLPQSLNYDSKILDQYIKKVRKKGIVLITLAPLVFAFLDYENETTNLKYYKFLKSKYIKGYSFYKKLKYKSLPLIFKPSLVKYIFGDVKPGKEIIFKENTIENVIEEANKREKGWSIQFSLENLKVNEVDKNIKNNMTETRKILSEMLNNCYINNLNPVIVIPPISKELYSKFSKKFLNTFLYENINIVKGETIVFDYLNDERLSDYKNYSNSDFLNLEGSKIFTNIVINDLYELKLLEKEV